MEEESNAIRDHAWLRRLVAGDTGTGFFFV
jgi:hypothetical protein